MQDLKIYFMPPEQLPKDKGFALLCDLAEGNGDEARAVLGSFIGGLGGEAVKGYHDMLKMGRILNEGQNNAALRALIEKQLPALTTLISRCDARETLVANDLAMFRS